MAVAQSGARGPSLKVGALVEGALLAGTLAVLVTAFLLVRPAAGGGPAVEPPAPHRSAAAASIRVDRPATYLVLLVQDVADMDDPALMSRAADIAADWITNIEVVGTEELAALDSFLVLRDSLAASECALGACPEVVVVDLR